VLASGRPCAYAWPDGTLFVTRGLLDLLDDDELAAALAHEMGHLSVGPATGYAALADEADAEPAAGTADVETTADAAGCDLLRASGLSLAALARALAKVRDAPQTPAACRPALSRRIRRLTRSGPSAGFFDGATG
jgi:Zn-dependent protease with chaperone function